MKKLLGLIVVGIAVAVMAAPNGYFKLNSDGTIDVVANEAELTSATISGALIVGNAISATGNISSSALTYGGLGTQSATNGAALTLSDNFTVVTGIGGANDTTNTVTLPSVAQAGAIYVIAVGASSTNLIAIADSGNAKLASAWVGDNNDTLTLIGDAGDNFIEVSRSDN